MFLVRQTKNQGPSPYATRSDFCRIFQQDMNRLYLLSHLLTADHDIAEQCFVGGLHIAQEGNQVFKEWAESWARRAIILNAIRMIRPRLTADAARPALNRNGGEAFTGQPEFNDVLELPIFERFVFIMSVLERYSDQECSLHLGCTRREIVAARTHALEHMGQTAEQRLKLVSIASEQKSQGESPSGVRMPALSGLAASA